MMLTTDDNDILWMQHALQLAKQAEQQGEVPVGAVLVYNNEIIGEGYNQSILNNDPTAHAEIIALRQAAQTIGNYRLLNTCLYVTLEPCAMCAGAMIHARIQRLVYGTSDLKSGAIDSVLQVTQKGLLNHDIICNKGILMIECSKILIEFFKGRR